MLHQFGVRGSTFQVICEFFIKKALVMPLKLLWLFFYFGSGWFPIGTGTWRMLCIISTNLSQKIIMDALDLDCFCKAFNDEVRYLRENFFIVFMM